jgi:hypothetical protein
LSTGTFQHIPFVISISPRVIAPVGIDPATVQTIFAEFVDGLRTMSHILDLKLLKAGIFVHADVLTLTDETDPTDPIGDSFTRPSARAYAEMNNAPKRGRSFRIMKSS